MPIEKDNDLIAQMLADAETEDDDFGLSDRDFAVLLLNHLDYEDQLVAMAEGGRCCYFDI